MTKIILARQRPGHARISENENHQGSARQSPMIIHFPITVIIQSDIRSDIEPIKGRLLDITFLVSVDSDLALSRQEEETEANMGDSSDSEEFEITDLVHQFMAVTGAEDTMALSYLQQSSWNVEVCAVFC